MENKKGPITIEEAKDIAKQRYTEQLNNWEDLIGTLSAGNQTLIEKMFEESYSPDSIYLNNPELYEKMKEDMIKSSKLYSPPKENIVQEYNDYDD